MEAGTNFQILNLALQSQIQKTLVGLRPNPMFRTKLCWLRILMDAKQVDF